VGPESKISGGVRYVAPSGLDTNVGSSNYPLKTLSKCVALAIEAGSSCVLRGGTYHEQVGITNNQNLTIMAYGGETVTFDGTKTLSGSWVQEGNTGTYKLSSPAFKPWQLFWGEKGTMLGLARHPYAVPWSWDMWTLDKSWRKEGSGSTFDNGASKTGHIKDGGGRCLPDPQLAYHHSIN
jgi:hypothetical protein